VHRVKGGDEVEVLGAVQRGRVTLLEPDIDQPAGLSLATPAASPASEISRPRNRLFGNAAAIRLIA
jgi:hypothetical protein